MTDTTNEQGASGAERRIYEQERLVFSAMEQLAEMMADESLSKADLARLLGTSRAYVTNLLSGRGNPTLRTLADVAVAMGFRFEMRHEPLRMAEFIEVPAQLVKRRSTTFHGLETAPRSATVGSGLAA